MTQHVRDLLYDYATGALDEAERTRVAGHLAHCPSCSGDFAIVQAALALLPKPATSPDEERDAAFWTSFANGVEARTRAATRRTASWPLAARDSLLSFIAFNRAPLLAGAGTIAMIAAAVVMFWPRATDQRPPEVGTSAENVMTVANEPTRRMNDYLTQSKVLLVGIVNMKADEGIPLDLSAEQRKSRALVHEARYLRQQPMDARSARLISDLEKILIELANMEEHQDLPDVELIRTGIRRENLLFKIRMAESYLDASARERTSP
jgi:hypothetical protein